MCHGGVDFVGEMAAAECLGADRLGPHDEHS